MIFAQNKNLEIAITNISSALCMLFFFEFKERETNEFKESKETVPKCNCSAQLQIIIELVCNQLINK